MGPSSKTIQDAHILANHIPYKLISVYIYIVTLYNSCIILADGLEL